MSNTEEQVEQTCTPSFTYKIRPPVLDEAVYITILVDGTKIIGLFINSKNMQSFPWISYATSSISERLQEGVSISKIIKGLKDTYDTSGGYIIPKSRGKKANSVLSHIGHVLELCHKSLQKEMPDEHSS